MASITERNGRFLVRVRREGFPTVTKTFTRRSDGAAWARRLEADMESGRWRASPAEVPTLRAAIQEYRKVVAPKMKGASTYRYRFDEFERLPFAALRISEVPVADLARWRDEQLAILRPGTVARKLAMLSSMFNWAQKERGWLTRNPLVQIRRPRADDSRTRTCIRRCRLSSSAHWSCPSTGTLAAQTLDSSSGYPTRRGRIFWGKGSAACLRGTGQRVSWRSRASKWRWTTTRPGRLSAFTLSQRSSTWSRTWRFRRLDGRSWLGAIATHRALRRVDSCLSRTTLVT
jgi:hypothetical protein